MPEVEYTATVDASVDRVWSYVEDLNRWCHLMIGFQNLEIVDDRRSIWTLRGDVGILTREVRIQVDITEWLPRDRVAFVVTGITERLEGGGAFVMTPGEPALAVGSGSAESPAKGAAAPSAPRRDGPLRRLRFRIARAMLRRLGRKSAAAQAAAREAVQVRAAGTPGASADGASSTLKFQLEVRPLGPMAPMLDLLMAPMLEPAAQDLADGIRAAVEG
jgi:hypothetical protein